MEISQMQQRYIPCLKCEDAKGPGERRLEKRFPNGNTFWRVYHENGETCEWMRYSSFENMCVAARKELAKEAREKDKMLKPKRAPEVKKRPYNPTFIVCPECGKSGRLNKLHQTDAQGNNKYVVNHEIIPGTWGATGLAKRRRCQFRNKKGMEQFKMITECTNCHGKTLVRKGGCVEGRIEWYYDKPNGQGDIICKKCYNRLHPHKRAGRSPS